MNPYTKSARLLIRLIGFGFVAVSLTLLGGDLFVVLARHEQGSVLKLGLEGFCLVLGALILWKSSKMARRLTEDFEE